MSGAGAAPVAAATGWTHGTASQLGDARSGKLADNLTGFGRALRRAGVPVDAARMALAQQALLLVGLARQDMAAALEAVLISREQDRQVFRELFAVYFRNPDVAQKLLAQMLPTAPEKSKGAPRRQRVADALAPLRAARQQHASTQEQKIEFDAAMTASDQQRLRRADFNQLSAGEYQLVQRLVREVALPLPRYASRRTCPGSRRTGPLPCAVQPARAARCWSCHAWRGATNRCRCWCWWMCRDQWSAMHACCSPSCTPPQRRGRAGRAWGDAMCSRLARASRI